MGTGTPNQGSVMPRDTLGCPSAPGQCSAARRTSHCAAWGGRGQCRSRQAAALGMVPRKLHLCQLLSDQHPAGATSPARPCQQRELCCNGPGSGGETRNLHLVSASFPLPAEAPGPGCAGDVLGCNLSPHPIGPHVSAPSLASDPRPTGKGAMLFDETDLPPQVHLLPPEADKCWTGKGKGQMEITSRRLSPSQAASPADWEQASPTAPHNLLSQGHRCL